MKYPIRIVAWAILVALTGCATQPTQPQETVGMQQPYDPLEPMNRAIYQVNKQLDRFILKPVSTAYVSYTPHFFQRSVSHFFANLRMIPSIVNSALQGNGEALVHNSGRFIMNSTLGVFGLLDLASDVKLYPHEEDFGQTLAVWGVRRSPYLVLPLYGPSTIRDGIGILVDQSVWSVWPYLDRDTYYWTATGLNMIDQRVKAMKQDEALQSMTIQDEYLAVRQMFLQYRQYQIEGAAALGDLDSEEIS